MLKKFLAELMVYWFPGLRTRPSERQEARASLGTGKPHINDWPRGRMLRQQVMVFDPSHPDRHYFIPSNTSKQWIWVQESIMKGHSLPSLQVRYVSEEDLPRNTANLM